MSPYERLYHKYRAERPEVDFPALVGWHLTRGFVFARPDFFIMGRPVIKSADHDKIRDPFHDFPSQDCDCWHIHAAAGNLGPMWNIMPWPLGWISWSRVGDPENGLRFFRADDLRRLCPKDLHADAPQLQESVLA